MKFFKEVKSNKKEKQKELILLEENFVTSQRKYKEKF